MTTAHQFPSFPILQRKNNARSVDVNVPCPQPSLHAQSGSVSVAGGPLPQQVLRVFNGNSEVRAAKVSEYRKIYANHFSLAVEEPSARTPRGCGGVLDHTFL